MSSEALKAFRVTNNVEYIQNLKKKRAQQKSQGKSRLQLKFIFFKNKLFFSSDTSSSASAAIPQQESYARQLLRKSTKKVKDFRFHKNTNNEDEYVDEKQSASSSSSSFNFNNNIDILNLLSLKSNRGSIHYSLSPRVKNNLLAAHSNASIDLLTTSISSLQLKSPPCCSFDNKSKYRSTRKSKKNYQSRFSDVRFIDDENSLFYVESALSNAVSSLSLIVTEDETPSNLTKNSNLLLSASKNSDKLNSTKVSLSNSLNDVSDDLNKNSFNEIGRVAKWATGFEKLLDDPIGLQIFTKFLKKEFSQENIEFWIKCENFKSLTGLNEMKEAAKEIWSTYLDTSSSYQINVDSKSRSHCKELLDNPTSNMFESAQLHIFSLMKYDSYARFLKSQMYKDCIVYEMEGKTLSQILNIVLNNNVQSASNSNPQSLKSSEVALATNNLEKLSTNDSTKKEKKRGTILPWTKGSKEKKSSKESNKLLSFQPQLPTIPSSNVAAACEQNTHDLIDPKFCRVGSSSSEGSTSLIPIQSGIQVYQALAKIFNRKQLPWYKFDIFIANEQSQHLIDPYSDSIVLSGREVLLEERCVFVLSLTSIVINLCVKTNYKKTIQSVIQPILDIYQISLSNSTIHLNSELGPLNLNETCAMIDNQHVLVIHKNQSNLLSRLEINSFVNVSINDFIPQNSEFTFQFDDLGILKQNSNIVSIQSRVKKQAVDDHDKSNLLELLNKVNNHRIDDQRGLIDTKNLEIPEFLLNTATSLTNQSLSNGVSPAQSRVNNISRSRSPIVLLNGEELENINKSSSPHSSSINKIQKINKNLFNHSPNTTPTKRTSQPVSTISTCSIVGSGLSEMIIVNDEFSYIIDTNQSFNESLNFNQSPSALTCTNLNNNVDNSKVSYV